MPFSKRKLAEDDLTRDKLAADSIRASELHYFLSAEQTGTGAEQSIAHGLGVTPSLVLIIITGSPTTYAALTVTEGVHDATNVKVTVTTDWKYKVFAMP